MSYLSDKMKFRLKRLAILSSLFLALFFLSYYVVNLLDIKPKIQNSPQIVNNADLKANDNQLKAQLGASNVSLAGFSDWARANNLTGNDIYNADQDKDGLSNALEYAYGTDPNNSDSDGDKFSDKQEINNGYDPDAPGDIRPLVVVKIDKLSVDAPMIWSKTDIEANMLKDLENGLSHYLGSAAPGQNGNMIVSGHSSNYIWAKGNYNHIFEKLNDLQNGDKISVQTIQRNGRVFTYNYVVNNKFVTTPDDEKIFNETTSPTLTLSTCWPIGTNLKRIIVKAEILKS